MASLFDCGVVVAAQPQLVLPEDETEGAASLASTVVTNAKANSHLPGWNCRQFFQTIVIGQCDPLLRKEFKEEVGVGRSLAADRRQHAKTKVPKGQGDRGDTV